MCGSACEYVVCARVCVCMCVYVCVSLNVTSLSWCTFPITCNIILLSCSSDSCSPRLHYDAARWAQHWPHLTLLVVQPWLPIVHFFIKMFLYLQTLVFVEDFWQRVVFTGRICHNGLPQVQRWLSVRVCHRDVDIQSQPTVAVGGDKRPGVSWIGHTNEIDVRPVVMDNTLAVHFIRPENKAVSIKRRGKKELFEVDGGTPMVPHWDYGHANNVEYSWNKELRKGKSWHFNI